MLASAAITYWSLARPLGVAQLPGIDPSQLVMALNLSEGTPARHCFIPRCVLACAHLRNLARSCTSAANQHACCLQARRRDASCWRQTVTCLCLTSCCTSLPTDRRMASDLHRAACCAACA